jgi:NAD(P)-dependent dehydrogenase (short-subunit alcohol dehydrogenase family)
LGARDVGRGERAAAELGARFVQLDVTSDGSVDAAVALVGDLDVLINKAGIMSRDDDHNDPSPDEVSRVFDTNVLGVVRVFHAFVPSLLRSGHGVVVNVSSGLGSIEGTLRRGAARRPVAYATSKAAVNMLTAQWSLSYPQLRVNAADPGYTATDLTDNQGVQTVHQGTDVIVELATIGADGPTGTSRSRHGVVAW